MNEALKYIYKDNYYQKKTFHFFILALMYFILSFYPYMQAGMYNAGMFFVTSHSAASVHAPLWNTLIIMIITLIMSGYSLSCIEAVTKQGNNIVLPFMNIGKNIVKGFKCAISVIAVFLMFGLFGLLAGLISPVAKIVTLIFILMVLIMGIIYAYYGNCLLWIFANNGGKVSTFLKLKKAMQVLRGAHGNYIKYLLFMFLLDCAVAILIAIFAVLFARLLQTPLLILIFTSIEAAIISAYTVFIRAYLLAKSVLPDRINML